MAGTCLFGGTCVEINQYDFRCICAPGRTGKRCASKKIVVYQFYAKLTSNGKTEFSKSAEYICYL